MDPVVQDIINRFTSSYKVVSKEKKDIMLKWDNTFEIQGLPLHNFKRVAAIGDGNCMLHSFLFATSAIYRSHDNKKRGDIANEWRKQLIDKTEELNEDADIFYAESGGRVVIQETIEELLPEEYTELGIEIGPIIARVYGHNWLAVRLDETGALYPVRQTYNNFDPAKPTIVIHYLGGGLDFGQGNQGFRIDGHYETVIHTTISTTNSPKHSKPSKPSKEAQNKSKSKRTTAKKAKDKTITLPPETIYVFPPGSLEPLLDLFNNPSPELEV
jgi:hypothetical protein